MSLMSFDSRRTGLGWLASLALLLSATAGAQPRVECENEELEIRSFRIELDPSSDADESRFTVKLIDKADNKDEEVRLKEDEPDPPFRRWSGHTKPRKVGDFLFQDVSVEVLKTGIPFKHPVTCEYEFREETCVGLIELEAWEEEDLVVHPIGHGVRVERVSVRTGEPRPLEQDDDCGLVSLLMHSRLKVDLVLVPADGGARFDLGSLTVSADGLTQGVSFRLRDLKSEAAAGVSGIEDEVSGLLQRRVGIPADQEFTLVAKDDGS